MRTAKFNLLDKFIARYRLARVTRYIGLNEAIFDFGCGVQHYLLSYAKNKFKVGYGLDYDINDATLGNIVLVNYKYQASLPLKDNFFDKVFALAVIEHFTEKEAQGLFLEFSRVLKDNGKIIITTPTPRAKKILDFLAFKLKIISTGEIADHKHYYSPDELFDVAALSKLRVVEHRFFQLGLNSLYILEKEKI